MGHQRKYLAIAVQTCKISLKKMIVRDIISILFFSKK